MPSATVTSRMPRPAAEVFALLHNYERRLEWDTLLKEARLTRGNVVAQKGATSLCVGKPMFGIIGIESEYIVFEAGEIAAVKMINHPPFFDRFGASIRHSDTDDGSTLTYKFTFESKPGFLSWVLNPIMLVCLRRETKQRLDSLARFMTPASQS